MEITYKDFNKNNSKDASMYVMKILNDMLNTLDYFNLVNKNNVSTIDYAYWSKQCKKGEDLNIELVKLDLLNGMDIYSISLKYFQPIEVIKEIKENKIDKNFNIIPSKLYTIKMLTEIFGLNYWDRRSLNNINTEGFYNNYDVNKNTKFFSGKFVLDNLHCFNNKTIKLDSTGNKYISERQASIMLRGTKTNRLIIDGDEKVFGIKIRTKEFGKVKGFLLSDCQEALKNKKYYTKRNSIDSYNKLEEHKKNYVRAEYIKKYGKTLKGTYIPKEEAIFIDKLSKNIALNGAVIKLATISQYRFLKKDIKEVFIRALKLFKFNLQKGNRKNETYGVLVKDKQRIQSMLDKLLDKQFKRTKNNYPIISINDLADLLDMIPITVKKFITDTGKLFGIPIDFKKSRYGGLGIDRTLVKSIVEEKSKYIYIFKTGIWNGLASRKITVIRKLFKDSFYGENLILSSSYHNLLLEIEKYKKK